MRDQSSGERGGGGGARFGVPADRPSGRGPGPGARPGPAPIDTGFHGFRAIPRTTAGRIGGLPNPAENGLFSMQCRDEKAANASPIGGGFEGHFSSSPKRLGHDAQPALERCRRRRVSCTPAINVPLGWTSGKLVEAKDRLTIRARKLRRGGERVQGFSLNASFSSPWKCFPCACRAPVYARLSGRHCIEYGREAKAWQPIREKPLTMQPYRRSKRP